jgi:ribosomal protein S18 acetylase RimI-like enzyme
MEKIGLSRQASGKLQFETALTINESHISVKFVFDYTEFRSWTKLEELLDSSEKYYQIVFLSENEKEISLENINPKENRIKIIARIFDLMKVEYEKESDFIKHHYTGFIGSHAYKDYLIKYAVTKYPVVLKTFLDKTGETITLRQSGEKLKYCLHDDKTEDIVRDERGELVYQTDEQLLAKGCPLYDTAIVAFNEKEESVALASDEWGADGIWVNPNYQNRGIGVEILTAFRSQFPEDRKMGQMTESGITLAKAYYRKNILKI